MKFKCFQYWDTVMRIFKYHTLGRFKTPQNFYFFWQEEYEASRPKDKG